MRFAPEYVTSVLNDNFEDAKELFLSPLMAIHYAHLTMLAAQGIVSAGDAHRLREALDGVSLDEVRQVKYDGSCEDLFFYIQDLILNACGDDGGGGAAGALGRTSRSNAEAAKDAKKYSTFLAAFAAFTFPGGVSSTSLPDCRLSAIHSIRRSTR